MRRRPRSSDTSAVGFWHATVRTCFGPWPIRPAPLAVIYALINQYAMVRVAETQDASLWTAAIGALPSTLSEIAALFVAAWIARAVQRRFDPDIRRRSIYLLSVGVATIIFSLLRLVIFRPDVEQAGMRPLRDYLSIMILTAVLGVAADRVTRQMRRTQEALDLVQVQREQLLVADEEARQEVAQYLHDNVQADLVVLAMQLRSQAATLPRQDAERLASVVDELDKVRLLDVRSASRRLTPDIEALGLPASLRELASGYAPAMDVVVSCPHGIAAGMPDLSLAIYRITEQALLNAATHGHATISEVSIHADPAGGVRLRVTNDGQPPGPAPVSGTGTAIIQAWVSRFDGEWSIAQRGERTEFTALLGTHPVPVRHRS